MSEFLARTWTGAAQGIAINGQDATATMTVHQNTTTTNVDATVRGGSGGGKEEREGVDFEYEAYDARLSGKVAGLYAELEALTMQVSRLRRTAPGASAERDGRGLVEGLEADIRRGGKVGEGEGEGKGVLKLEGLREGWEEDVGSLWERGLGELRRLGGQGGSGSVEDGSGSLTETVGKVQRAKIVATELE